MTIRLFPSGIATGRAFCDRAAEREELGQRIVHGRHTWLAAPRRYGKSSLIRQTLIDHTRKSAKDKLPVRGAIIDLLVSYDAASAQQALLDAVAAAVADILPAHKKLLEAARRLFAIFRPEVVVSEQGARLRLRAEPGEPRRIVESLGGLDRLAGEQSVRVVLVIDEFQQIDTLKDSAAIEAQIRHAVEQAQQVTYIFSGSHRALLAKLFEDRSRPLYRLCYPMTLERIAASDYAAFLDKAARSTWGTTLDEPARRTIIERTECHPYYLNFACQPLWERDKPPSTAQVKLRWQQVVEDASGWLSADVATLNPNQRAVLSALAAEPTNEPYGKAFLQRTGLASSSAKKAVTELLEHDHIWTHASGTLRVLDPAMRSFLSAERARAISSTSTRKRSRK